MCMYQRLSLMRCCRHADGRCLDGDAPCSECDTEGYALDARRRLKRTADDMVEDVDDGQRFRVKRTKTGSERLVPVFNGPVDWKTAQGFARMLIILSCIGANDEYVIWDSITDRQMNADAWVLLLKDNTDKENKYYRNRHYTTTRQLHIKHANCGETHSGCIESLNQGKLPGCSCTYKRCAESRRDTWRWKRNKIVQQGMKHSRPYRVLTSEQEWLSSCHGFTWCPRLQCVPCGEIHDTASVNNLDRGQSMNCKCAHDGFKRERHRRFHRCRFVSIGAEKGFDVCTDEDEWKQQCTGANWCPRLRCHTCRHVVDSTQLRALEQGQGIGCMCHNKTENKLLEWLQTRLPSATVTTQHRGPKTKCGGQTHFDFLITFPDGCRVILELDGAQHFWNTLKYFSDDGCERDLLKESWALHQGLCVIRVLQEDVWNDRLDWQGWITRSIEAARECGDARVFTPDAPEYRSNESAYVKLHESGTVPT